MEKKLFEKFKVGIHYSRVFTGKEMALDMINDKWAASFHLLHDFRPKVGRASPFSAVHIETKLVKPKSTVNGGKRYTMKEKICFRR